MATELTLDEIARRIGGSVRGDGSVRIARLRDLGSAGAGDLSFLANPRYRPLLGRTRASAVILAAGEPDVALPSIRVADPYVGFCRALGLFHPPFPRRAPGVHPTAVIDPSASLGRGVHIGPLCVIEARARIGDDATLRAAVFVGEGSAIGEGTCVYPNVVIREGVTIGRRVILHPGVVIGGDGFGFAREESGYLKIPQIGGVVIGDDVEIGANSTVDRGALGDTRIGRGTKIDNLVMVAHNVVVGEDCLLVAQSGLAGSAKIGDRVTVAAQAGVAGHVEIGAGATIAGGAGATKSLPSGGVYSGMPAAPRARTLRVWAEEARLPETVERIRELERKVERLEKRAAGPGRAKKKARPTPSSGKRGAGASRAGSPRTRSSGKRGESRPTGTR